MEASRKVTCHGGTKRSVRIREMNAVDDSVKGQKWNLNVSREMTWQFSCNRKRILKFSQGLNEVVVYLQFINECKMLQKSNCKQFL